MERTEWLTRLCADNDPARVPTTPFSIKLGDDYYTLATDRFTVACVVATTNTLFSIPPPPTPSTRKKLFDKVVKIVRDAQNTSVEIGVLDALLVKELVGEPQWGPEHMKTLFEAECPYIRIKEAYYSALALARLLAGWDAPLALVHQAPVTDGDSPALLLTTQNMVLICAPVRMGTGGPLAVIQLPAGAFMEK